MQLRDNVVISHYPDSDGEVGAYIVEKYYFGNDATILWLDNDRRVYDTHRKYGDNKIMDKLDIDLLKGKNVIMVDISLSHKEMDDIFRVSRSFECYDHHKLDKALINMPYMNHAYDKCGTSLIWDSLDIGKNHLVDLVEYRDIFTKKHPDTDKMYIALNNGSKEEILDALKNDESVTPLLEKYHDEWIEYRDTIQSYVDKAILQKWLLPYDGELMEWSIYVNHDIPKEYVSDVGYILSRKECSFYMNITTKEFGYEFNIRSDERDIEPIAKYLGGGGHPVACGFRSTCVKTLETVKEDIGITSMIKYLYNDIRIPSNTTYNHHYVCTHQVKVTY